MNLCNDVDEWGLVDYEMGVWEEQIIDCTFCRDTFSQTGLPAC